ncbi:uncharacterized protein LOC120412772 [Culex pipiens pallens]|uniref:uncharacterized protein LOC120412772 n=1 Tax=Culex pipiens pallens TaxID=42434 RepID=UPI0019543E40|nr:uncharacterized protein LOC120412772 [Culex pipiens pallens]
MFREVLPILAYMSVLSSTYSLHMARDAYLKAPPPPPPASAQQLLEELDDMSELLAAENAIPAAPPIPNNNPHQQLLQQQQQLAVGAAMQQAHLGIATSSGAASGGPHGVVINHLTSNELPELSPPPVRHPVGPLIQPRGLQELFGVQNNYVGHNNPHNAQQNRPQQQNRNAAELVGDDDDEDGADQPLEQRNPANNKRSSSSSSASSSGSSGDSSGQNGGGAAGGSAGGMPSIPHGMASQLMLRSARGQRQYDVPQIECPPAMDGMERFACPTPDRQGRYRCIDDHVLCDGFIDCPEGEDEDRQACMFYKTTKAHLDVLADALLRWARGR